MLSDGSEVERQGGLQAGRRDVPGRRYSSLQGGDDGSVVAESRGRSASRCSLAGGQKLRKTAASHPANSQRCEGANQRRRALQVAVPADNDQSGRPWPGSRPRRRPGANRRGHPFHKWCPHKRNPGIAALEARGRRAIGIHRKARTAWPRLRQAWLSSVELG